MNFSLENNLGPTSNNSELKNMLHNIPNFLNIGHVNCQSIKSSNNSFSIEELKSVLDGNYLDIIGISETWLKPFVSDNAISMVTTFVVMIV